MSQKIKYPIVIYPAKEGGYVAEIPALQGCLAQGESILECFAELETVMTLWLECAKRNRQKLPSAAQVTAKLRQMTA